MSRTTSKDSNGNLKLMAHQSSLPSQEQQQQQQPWYLQPQYSVGSSKQTSPSITSQQQVFSIYH